MVHGVGAGKNRPGGRRLPDEAARERVRTQLDVTFLVEAGAGTGKTRLLVDRVERLIVTGTARMRDIVAITFTETAAAELHVAIRQRLEAVLREATGEARTRLRTALEDLDIASVSTIHAFAADLLRERPVEAEVDPGFTVADELAASLLRRQAWDRWMGEQKDGAHDALREAVELGLRLDQLRVAGDELLRYRDVLTAELDRGPRPRDPLVWLRGAEPQMRACIARVTTDCLDHEDKAVSDLRALEWRLDLLARLPEAEARRFLLSEFTLKVGGNQGRWRPGVLREIKQRLEGLAAEMEELRVAYGHWLAAGMANWLRGYTQAYQAAKATRGLLDFDDLLLCARNLLRDKPEVRSYFQDRFAAILVDEFQDTDPLQAEIVFFLAEDGARARAWDRVRLRPGKLFIVGDPKQSIYAFRRADIETYERAKEVLLRSGRIEYITANFRSVREILEAVNATFEGVMRPPDEGKYQPEYVALQPSTTTLRAGDAPALVLLYPDPEGAPERSTGELREDEAEALAAYLRRQIERRAWKVGDDRRFASYGDVALLFRGLGDVPAYEEALSRYGIPYRVTSSRTFYGCEEVGWLHNLLHAVEHPTDPVAVWGALRSPLFGCSDREIYEFTAGGGAFDYRLSDCDGPGPGTSGRAPVTLSRTPESIAAAFATLRELHAARNLWSVPRLVEEVLDRTQGRLTFLLTPQGEQRVANLGKVVTMARALEESGPLSLRAFVRWLREMEETAVQEAESPTVEPGDDVVRLMSIHAAKGLEFPVVIVPDLGRGPGGGARNLLLQRVRNVSATYVGKVSNLWPIQTHNYEALKEEQEQREAAERLRLLYVAMPRAKDALVLPVCPKSPGKSMMADLAHVLPQQPELGRQHNGWLTVDGSTIPRMASSPAAVRLRLTKQMTPDAKALARERAVWLDARKAHLEACAHPDRVQRPSALVDKDALAALKPGGARLETERGGRRLGELVHAVLAVIPFDRPDLVEAYVRVLGRQRGLADRLAERAKGLVRSALASDVVRSVEGGRSWREVPFVVATPEGTMEGAIDLLVEAEGGVNIADYKTDAVGEAQRGALEAAYAPQLEAYAKAVGQAGIDVTRRRLHVLLDPARPR